MCLCLETVPKTAVAFAELAAICTASTGYADRGVRIRRPKAESERQKSSLEELYLTQAMIRDETGFKAHTTNASSYGSDTTSRERWRRGEPAEVHGKFHSCQGSPGSQKAGSQPVGCFVFYSFVFKLLNVLCATCARAVLIVSDTYVSVYGPHYGELKQRTHDSATIPRCRTCCYLSAARYRIVRGNKLIRRSFCVHPGASERPPLHALCL